MRGVRNDPPFVPRWACFVARRDRPRRPCPSPRRLGAERRPARLESERSPGEGDVRQAAGDRRADRDGAAQQRGVHESEPGRASTSSRPRAKGFHRSTLFGKPHYRLGGVEIDYKANRARALTTRGSVGLTLLDPTTGATRTIETPKGALVNGATGRRTARSIGYIASFDARDAHLRRRRRDGQVDADHAKTPLLADARDDASTGRRTARASSRCCCRTIARAEPKRPPVETGPLVRTSEAGKVLQNRNYASLLRDPYEKDLLDYYTIGQLAVIDVKTKAVEEDRRAGADHECRCVARRSVLPRHAADEAVLVPRAGRRTSERSSSCGTRTARSLAEISKTVLREGTGGANDTTAFAGGAGFGGRGGARRTRASATSSGIRSAPGLVYLQSEAGAGRAERGRAAVAARGGAGRGGRRRRAAAAVRRIGRIASSSWSPPFGASDAKQIFEANSRMTSAEFSADGKTLFVNEGSDLYAVRLADPTKHYEIAKGATIAAGGRGGRGGGGGGGGGRGGAQSDSAFFANPGALQMKRGPNGAAGRPRLDATARASSSRARSTSRIGRSRRRTTSSTRSTSRPAQKTRAVRGQGRHRGRRRRAARRRLLEGHRGQAVADDGSGLVPARHEDGHRDEADEERRLRAGSVAGDSQAHCSSSVRATATSSTSTSRCRRTTAKARGCRASSGSTRREFSTQHGVRSAPSHDEHQSVRQRRARAARRSG